MVLGDGKWEKRFLFDVSTNVTAVPNLLIKFYRQLGLSEGEFIFLIQIFGLTGTGCPAVEQIAEYLGIEVIDVKNNMASLMEKGIVVAESRMENGSARVPRYFFDGLYDKLMDLWACQMAGELEAAPAAEAKGSVSEEKNFSLVYTAFEKEFGRGLSPMESEKIIEWLDRLAYKPEIVLESLKRAVLRGIYNFNYVDRILLEWQKSNLRTLNDIQKFESEKMSREKPGRKKTSVVAPGSKVKSLYEI